MTEENKDKALALAAELGLKTQARAFVARDGSQRWNVFLFVKTDDVEGAPYGWPGGGVPAPFTALDKFKRYAKGFTREFVAA